jgi:cyclic pyranopterin phosphate synthase
MKKLTHLTERGEAHMVDVGAKPASARRAVALARVTMAKETVERVRAGDTPKGDVLATVRIAGIQAAKRTSDLIPLCHPLALTRIAVDVELVEAGAEIRVVAEAFDRTGVEMEALTGASVGALALYDMLKAIDREITFEVRLLEKSK